nr:HhoA/HhoB/HtrA family serine endopeptidase [Petrachloros mirabilis]
MGKKITSLTMGRFFQLSLLSLVLGLGVLQGGCQVETSTQDSASEPLFPTPGSGELSASAIVNVVEQVGPAVVRIDAARNVNSSTNPMPSPFGFPFAPPQDRVEQGTGSGFIFNANGLILTNAHVVEGANQVTVTLRDGNQYQGQVLGADPLTDLAVVEIDAANLPQASLGNSDMLRPGEWAIAIGNPLGLDNTVTVGIISATGRSSSEVGVPDQRVNFIQTDAAINPGNSGGPLLNLQGEVIGVNTAIISGAQGLGFAIPVSLAQRVATQLAAGEPVDHAFMGVRMADLTPELQEEINMSQSEFEVRRESGVLIVEVLPNSPAEVGGLQAGDVIVQLQDQTAPSARTVQEVVEAAAPNDILTLRVERGTEEQQVQVQLGNLPTPEPQNP